MTSELSTKLAKTSEDVVRLTAELKENVDSKHDLQTQLDDYIFQYNEKVIEAGNLKEELQAEQTNHQKLKSDVLEMEAMCMSMRKEIEDEKKKTRRKLHAETRKSVEQNRVALDQMEKLVNDKNVSILYYLAF